MGESFHFYGIVFRSAQIHGKCVFTNHTILGALYIPLELLFYQRANTIYNESGQSSRETENVLPLGLARY